MAGHAPGPGDLSSHPSGLWLPAAACPARAQANQVTGRSKLIQGGPKVMSQRFELIASDPQNFFRSVPGQSLAQGISKNYRN